MSEKNIKFDNKKINKSNYYKNKKPFVMDYTYINKILISKKEPYIKKISFRYLIGYKDNDNIRPLCIKLPQMTEYVRCFDSNKTISFKVIDKKTVKKYIKLWEIINSLIGKEFDSEPVYGDNEKYIKTKIKSYRDKVNTNASHKCLSLMMLDSVIRVNKKYYPQTHLEDCKYEIKKNRIENLINDNLDLSSSDESDNKFDNESNNEFDNDEN